MIVLILSVLLAVGAAEPIRRSPELPAADCQIPPRPNTWLPPAKDVEFNYKWLGADGEVYDDEVFPGQMLEIAATQLINEPAFEHGAVIVQAMMSNSPPQVFSELVTRGSVGLFTWTDTTTIFPEYRHLADRPECAGTCAGACSNTCTADGRKWDSLAGVGGTRATCVDSNFMCLPDDPYQHSSNILVHEFAHTIHQYGLRYASNYWDLIQNAYWNALNNNIWDRSSYAMVNHLEYFAEASAVFFNVNFHPTSSGGMNSCGQPGGFCQSEAEARAWLLSRDPALHDALSFTYTNNNPSIPGNINVCP